MPATVAIPLPSNLVNVPAARTLLRYEAPRAPRDRARPKDGTRSIPQVVYTHANRPLTKTELIALPEIGHPARLSDLIGVSRQAIDAWPEVLKHRQENEVLGMLLREGIPIPANWMERLWRRACTPGGRSLISQG